VTISDGDLVGLKGVCPGARYLEEGGVGFIDLPALRFKAGEELIQRDALLSLQAHTGYTSRLYLSEQVPGFGKNWTQHVVLGRGWYTPSWNLVMVDRPLVMLQNHLRAYQPCL
jgi:hypothetical protein